MILPILFTYFLFFSGFMVYVSKFKHLLLMLLSLEYMVMGIFFSLLLCFSSLNYFFCLVYLVFSTCEGALGLSIMVSMVRTYGSDYFFLMNFS